MDLNVECQRFALKVIRLIERNVGATLRGTVKATLIKGRGLRLVEAKPTKRKAKRARIRCRACKRVGHNARNPRCPAKAKRASLHVVAGKKAA